MKHAFSRMILFVIQLLAYVLSTCVKIYRSVREQSSCVEYTDKLRENDNGFVIRLRKSIQLEVNYDGFTSKISDSTRNEEGQSGSRKSEI